MHLNPQTGLVDSVQYIPSENCDYRETFEEPHVIVIHCISLPPGVYGGHEVIDLFTNQLDIGADPYFEQLQDIRVSAHFYIRRDGEVIQFVPTNKRAWHAGESSCLNRPKVNDFSIGIELEGLDSDSAGFTDAQYTQLQALNSCLMNTYSNISWSNVFAHSDIAPGRKPDPGPYFEWSRTI